MGATDITEPQGQPSEQRQGKAVVITSLRFRSLCCGFWFFPSVSSRTTKARALRQWEQQTSENRQRQRQPFRHPWPLSAMTTDKARTFAPMEATDITEPQGKAVPIPSLLIPFPLLAVGSWLVSSESSRSNHCNDVPAMGATDITEPTRQGRSDSLVAIPFPLLAAGSWLVPSVRSGSNHGKGNHRSNGNRSATVDAFGKEIRQGKGVPSKYY